MKTTFCLLLLLPTLQAFTQISNEREKRDSFTLIMPVAKETFYESRIPSSPYIVGPGILQLFPGDTVYIEMEQKDGTISGLKSVKENKNPDKTLEITFTQTVTGNTHTNMMLKVKNPFKKNLTYEAMIRYMDTGKWEATSIMPVIAGIWGYEMWQDVIVSIALSEWKLL
jgi:hypothetical protein